MIAAISLFALVLLPIIISLSAQSQNDASSSQANQNQQQQQAFKHPLTDMPSASEDIDTSYYFPSQPDLKLPIGEVITTLCHLTNTGSNYYNISAIMGSLNAPFDFRHHFQNYSYKLIGMVVKSDEEITLKYSFQLHPDLDPVDYQLAITVFYESETESFSTTFFNKTVELYSPASEYDFETVSSVIYSLVSTVVVIVLAVFACFPESKVSQQISKELKRVLPNDFYNTNQVVNYGEDEDDDDWQVVENKKRRKAQSNGKRGSHDEGHNVNHTSETEEN